ncbi:MAG: acyl carrier protein [Acidimicrobiales bacterium]
MTDGTADEIRKIVGAYGQLVVDVDSLSDDDDLYEAGMSSNATVSVMLALEQTFNIEFPESVLRRSVFTTLRSIRESVAELGVEGALA